MQPACNDMLCRTLALLSADRSATVYVLTVPQRSELQIILALHTALE